MTDIARERRLLDQQGLKIIHRETWDAVEDYTSARVVEEPVKWFFLHISVTIDGGDLTGDEHDDMRTIERIGQERFEIGFPYNAAIFDTGRLYEGQPLTRRGAHTVNDKGITGFPKSLNYAGRAICLPQMVSDDVTDAQVDMAARWAAAQIRSGMARTDATWYGHRDFAWKACPGDAGYGRLPEIRALTAHYVKVGLGPVVETPLPQGDGPMIYELLKKNADGSTWTMVVLLSGNKQVRLDGNETALNVKRSAPYIGQINETSYNRLVKAYGEPIV